MKEVVLCISPKGSVLEELHHLMVRAAKEMNSQKALIFPPHLTLVHRIHVDDFKNFLNEIKTKARDIKRFKLEFKDFGNFDNPTIIYLRPIKIDMLKELHAMLLPLAKKYKDSWIRESFLKMNLQGKQKEYRDNYGSPYCLEFFNSHITIAGPDVDEESFRRFVIQNKSYEMNFIVEDIAIMTREEGKWEIKERISLK